MIRDRIVESDVAALHVLEHERRRHQLRDRADLEQHVRIRAHSGYVGLAALAPTRARDGDHGMGRTMSADRRGEDLLQRLHPR